MKKTLRVLMLLSGNRKYTMSEMTEKLEVSERTIFRYLRDIEIGGFVIDRSPDGYQLLQSNYNTKSLKELTHFSEEEVHLLYRALLELENYNCEDTRKLIAKIHSLYDFKILQSYEKEGDMAKLKSLAIAIEQKRQVVLHNYRSSNSHKVEDRFVEPFEMMEDYKAVWCYDLRDHKIKQFKISRIHEVDILSSSWKYGEHHNLPFSDAFRMSAPKPITHVKAILSLKAYNLLKEEYPSAMCCVEKLEDNYQLDIPIANFHGIGRFVLGLIDEIEILSPQQFKDFLKEKIKTNLH